MYILQLAKGSLEIAKAIVYQVYPLQFWIFTIVLSYGDMSCLAIYNPPH